MNLITFGAVLLLIGGIVQAIPPLNASLVGIFNGTPIIQILVGVLSLVVGAVIMMKRHVLS